MIIDTTAGESSQISPNKKNTKYNLQVIIITDIYLIIAFQGM